MLHTITNRLPTFIGTRIFSFGYAGVVSLLNRLEEVLLERKKR